MQVERKYTKAGQDAYAEIEFRQATSEIKNPDGSVVFRLENIEVPASWSQVASDVLAQKYFRKAGVPARLKRVEEETVPVLAVALGRPTRRRWPSCPKSERYRRRNSRQAGVRPPGRHLDLLGLEGRLFRHRGRRPRLLRRAALHAGHADGRAELAAVVQHRPALGLRHRRPGQGHYYVDSETGKLTQVRSPPTSIRSRTPASSSRSQDDLVNEGGIMDLWVREARLFKYGSGTGSNFSHAARRGREALGRRQVLRPDELPQDRRPRGGRHQVGRHHAPRRQDGDRRRRPPRHRGLHRLEGAARSRRSPRSSPAPRSSRST